MIIGSITSLTKCLTYSTGLPQDTFDSIAGHVNFNSSIIRNYHTLQPKKKTFCILFYNFGPFFFALHNITLYGHEYEGKLTLKVIHYAAKSLSLYLKAYNNKHCHCKFHNVNDEAVISQIPLCPQKLLTFLSSAFQMWEPNNNNIIVL